MERHGFVLAETGDWDHVTGFCARLAAALDGVVPPETVDRFDAWRPRADESETAVRARTVDDEVVQETDIERASQGPRAELSRAGADLKQGGTDAVHRDARGTLDDIEDAGRSTARGLVPALVRLFRRVERLVYRYITSRTSPDIFESEPVTVTLRGHSIHPGRYTVRVDFRDHDLLDAVAAELE